VPHGPRVSRVLLVFLLAAGGLLLMLATTAARRSAPTTDDQAALSPVGQRRQQQEHPSQERPSDPATPANEAPLLAAQSVDRSVTPLPACTFDDLPAAKSSYDQWDQTVLDTVYALP